MIRGPLPFSPRQLATISLRTARLAALLIPLFASMVVAGQEEGDDPNAPRPESTDPLAVAGALVEQAETEIRASRYDQAREHLQDASALLEDLDGSLELAIVLRSLGVAAWSIDERPLAVQAAGRAYELAQVYWESSDPELFPFRANWGLILMFEGRMEEARDVYIALIEEKAAATSPDDLRLLGFRGNLAAILAHTGELDRAIAIRSDVLSRLERLLPEEHKTRLKAQKALGNALVASGDSRGARHLFEQVIEVYERTRPPNDLDLIRTRNGLAVSLSLLGEDAAALEILEDVLARLPDDHLQYFSVRTNIGIALHNLKRYEEAVKVRRELAAHPLASSNVHHLRSVRANLATTLRRLGELVEARELQGAVLASYSADWDPTDLQATENLLGLSLILVNQGELELAAERVVELLDAHSELLAWTGTRSRREAAEVVRRIVDQFSRTQSLALKCGVDEREIFAAAQSLRSAAAGSPGGRGHEDEEAQRLATRVLELRGRVNDLAAAPGEAGEQRRHELETAVRSRDLAERELRAMLTERELAPITIDADRLATSLPGNAAAVGFWSFDLDHFEDPSERLVERWLIAHVVQSGDDGETRFARVDLGPMDPILERIDSWRAAISHPLAAHRSARAERGVALGKGVSSGDLAAAGAELFEVLLAPVLEEAGGASTFYVVTVFGLHHLPLDALPHPDPEIEVLGDVFEFHQQVSFARLVAPRPLNRSAPSLVAFGGIDFGEADPQTFVPLPASLGEVRALGELFTEALDAEPVVWTGTNASREALRASTSGTRWLHPATHGWFDRASDASDATDNTSSFERSVSTLSPMSRCGLALAGANLPADATGRLWGRVTAEEIAGLDLSACELAVLSACETGAGLRGGGVDVESLRSALHAAGARATLTSLWKVDDEWTRELMTGFYRRMWVDGRPKAHALWEAKRALRERGAELRHWAGWVLAGDPR